MTPKMRSTTAVWALAVLFASSLIPDSVLADDDGISACLCACTCGEAKMERFCRSLENIETAVRDACLAVANGPIATCKGFCHLNMAYIKVKNSLDD
ncbi:unnamed protein product [Darwinula stevensoni]|uniref:Uncharacterized protein n=1 Tax=Darwinula stevensoni TaxID=69355 RepID=A0A7R9A7S3_9CRUS|nr:unnamed protein product [Darwinula stevensoni]CAG0894754.1 unnamed protein product [Darwinula stevensoni]